MNVARFRKMREKNDYTQKSLADKLGISSSTVSMWERGDRDPDTDMLVKICDVLNVSADYLLGRVHSPDVAIMEDLPPELKAAGIESLYVLKDAIKTGLTADEIQEALTFIARMKKKAPKS